MKTFADRLKISHGTVQRAPVSAVPWCGLPAAGRLEVQYVLRGTKVQPKLEVGAANDAFEQEADRVAEQVMRMPDSPAGELPEEEEEKLVSPKADTGGVTPLSEELADRIQALEGGGSPLSEGERTFFEPRFGADFSQVRVHTGPAAEEAASALNAQAFTLGSDIAFGPGRYAPGTEKGNRLMAHELTHVVQQGGGEEEAI